MASFEAVEMIKNKQKIEDANGVIKRHTEQLIELEPEINDLKHEMSELDRHVKGKYVLIRDHVRYF